MEELFINRNITDTVENMEQYAYSNRFFSGKYAKQFFSVLMTNLTTLVFLAVDGLFVSNFVGADALNSVNLIQPFVQFIGATTLLLAAGIGISLSKTFGLGSELAVKKIYRATVLLVTIFVIGTTLFQIILLKGVIGGYNVDASIKDMMREYSIGIIIANSVSVITTAGTHFLLSSGKVKQLFQLAILESTLNIILDIIFVPVLHMGIIGASMGTAISCTVRAAATVFLVQKSHKIFPIEKVSCREEIRQILSSGFPSMVRVLLLPISGYVINNIILGYGGLDAITVISVCAFAENLIAAVIRSFIQTGKPVLGLFVGTEDWETARDLIIKILKICVPVTVCFVLLFGIFPQSLFIIYGIEKYTSAQLVLATEYVLKYIPFAFTCCLTEMCIYCNKRKTAVIVSIAESLLVIPVFIIMCYISTKHCFLCYVICGIIAAVIMVVVTGKALKQNIEIERASGRIYFTFKSGEALDVSRKLNQFLLANNVAKKTAYRIALFCEEIGAYSANEANNKEINIFLSIKKADDKLLLFYLDDSTPAILNKKLKATDLVLGNYNLIESIASEYTYQNIGGMNNFIVRFTL